MPALAPVVIDVRGLTKRYGNHSILRDVTFDVRRGEIFGLLGTNGAGKTTTVEILQGLRRADGGEVAILGLDPARQGDALRRRIGSQLQDAALADRMRVHEALRLFAALHPSPRPVEELLEEWNLAHLRRRPFGALSGGERQRLFVALALIGRPELVFLDELTQNLDPASRRQTWDVIRRLRDTGTTVVLVTHDVDEAERICDRLAIFHAGSVVALGDPATIVRGYGHATTVSFSGRGVSRRHLRNLPGVTHIGRDGDRIVVEGRGAIAAYVGARLVEIGRPPDDLAVRTPDLEDWFLSLTTAEAVR